MVSKNMPAILVEKRNCLRKMPRTRRKVGYSPIGYNTAADAFGAALSQP
jgi:hypothetical protein